MADFVAQCNGTRTKVRGTSPNKKAKAKALHAAAKEYVIHSLLIILGSWVKENLLKKLWELCRTSYMIKSKSYIIGTTIYIVYFPQGILSKVHSGPVRGRWKKPIRRFCILRLTCRILMQILPPARMMRLLINNFSSSMFLNMLHRYLTSRSFVLLWD